jgi:hypothetical protein
MNTDAGGKILLRMHRIRPDSYSQHCWQENCLVRASLRGLYFACVCRSSGECVGVYCQYKNPCKNGEQKCQNGGTCTVLYSSTQAPTFKVCLFLCFHSCLLFLTELAGTGMKSLIISLLCLIEWEW